MSTNSLLLLSPLDNEPGWLQLHAQLARLPWPACPLPQLAGLTLYHYCVAKSSGRTPDAALAQAWLAQSMAQLHPLPAAWVPALLDQAALLAWLNVDGLAEPAALLTELDGHLHQEALRLQSGIATDTVSRQAFFQVLRYFSLRLPAAHPHLRAVIEAWPATPAPPSNWLGLVQGTAAELLICIRLAQAGVQTDRLTHFVREGLRYLLAAKGNVDFSRQRYAVFPDKLVSPAGHPIFSAEMSWRRGDLGQALLLYEAHALLQDPEIAYFADLVGLQTLLRTTSSTTEIASASLYRGSAGVAHLYRRLYQLSRQPAYLRGYEFWLGQTHSWLPATLSARPVQDALRDGLAGVGLVLLSARSEQEINWENSVLGAS
jgi:hypothetical protein